KTDAKTETLAELQRKYPDGKYWNGGNPDSVTDEPCTHHSDGCEYDGSCGCNSFKGTSIQCMGFANQLAYLVYGGNPYYNWTKYYGDAAFELIKAGDIVRYKNSGHSIFVTAVDEDTITFADCNYHHTCKIRWNQTISKETLKKTFTYVARAPYAIGDTEAATCECVDSYAGEYKCITENYPLNVRAGHATTSAKIGSIPKGATVTVTHSDGNWAHVIYEDIKGYASMEYLELIKPDADLRLDKNILNLSIPDKESDTVTILRPDSLPKDAKITFEYDKDIISIKQKDDVITVKALKEGEADLVVNASDSKGIIVSVKCGVFIEKKLIDSSEKFTDVSKTAWYKDFVDYAVTKEIFGGMSETEFSPDTFMTRAQFVQVLANISKVDTTDKKAETDFSDVKSGAWYAPAVKWAVSNGIAGGMGNGTFEPETKITREQMCVMLVNYVESFKKTKLLTKEVKNEFADDATISNWAKEKVYKCQMADIVNGKDGNLFDPKADATRAQGATIFTQFHKDYIA
ncbi:MAG: S-layer homology domain-containing protein, partial [Clostridia bacterium]|nr:S-layer homology domain-containing protein [Clostridia bacterium]